MNAATSSHLEPPLGGRAPVTRYELRDASGLLVAVHCRQDGPDGKRMWWELPDGTPGLGGMHVADLPLYGIERLDAFGATVVIVEGEKAAEALWSLGIAAVGTVTGAHTTPSRAVLAELTGRRVILWSDADDVGRKHMAAIAAILVELGCMVTIVDPPEGVVSGWDAADAVAEGHDVDSILAGAEPVMARPGPGATEEQVQPKVGARGRFLERTAEELLADSESTPDPPSLLFLGQAGYLFEGWSHLVSGYPRIGKTELLADSVIGWLATGLEVLYLTEEAEPLWRMRLRRLAASRPGVAWSHLHLVFGLGAGREALLERASEGTEAIVVVDATRNLLGLVDENDNSEVARVLNPWVAAMRDASKTLVVAHHVRKGGGDHGEGIAGAHAFLGVFDVALEVVRDPQATRSNRRIVRPYARVVSPPELVYERLDDGAFHALGDPEALRIGEVQDRLEVLLTAAPQATSALREGLGDPQPSLEQVRLALNALARAGRADRDPPIALGAARGRSVTWTTPTAGSGSSNDPVSRWEAVLRGVPDPQGEPDGPRSATGAHPKGEAQP